MQTKYKALLSGLEAVQQGRNAEAIDLLEMFCQLSKVNREYWQAQIGLVQAYQGDEQTEKAIALCQKLLVNKNFEVQAWARNFLAEFAPVVLPAIASQPQASPAGAALTSNIKLKTLKQLKTFYYENLFFELKAFEATKKLF